jgi:hypothetical protein
VAQRATAGDHVTSQLAALPGQVAAGIQHASATRTPVQQNRSLIDVKGLGRPPSFNGGQSEFNVWSRKFENYIVSVFVKGLKP